MRRPAPGPAGRRLAALAAVLLACGGSPAPPCRFEYSDWSACLPAGTQWREATASAPAGCSGAPELSRPCSASPRVDLGGVFAPGAVLRDAYGGGTVTVDEAGAVTVPPGPEGVVLLERDAAGAPPPGTAFRWRNALLYHALVDRFANGDPANDRSYGTRPPDGDLEIGTWHGGDLAGLGARLDDLAALGVTALDLTPVVEQVHGWIATTGAFKYFGYHGRWAADFTRLDANFGTAEELRALVDAAHARGLRLLLDVELNHPGYATGDELVGCLPAVFRDGTGEAFRAFSPTPGETWLDWNRLLDYGSPAWAGWWGPDWVRAGLGGGYPPGGQTLATRQVDNLPDFRTEAAQPVELPPVFRSLACRPATEVTAVPGFTVRDYLVAWQAAWIRRLGLDGLRCGSARHVEPASWMALRAAGAAALADWRAGHLAGGPPGDLPLWTLGDYAGHGVSRDVATALGGFDAVMNYEFQPDLLALLRAHRSLAGGAEALEHLYRRYAAALASDPALGIVSFLSSLDTTLFFDAAGLDAARQRQAGTALLLAPGTAMLLYGDESGRRAGPPSSPAGLSAHSDMNWATAETAIRDHFATVGAFRARHAAVGAGTHRRLQAPDDLYAFARVLEDGAERDAVVVILAPPR